MALNFVSIRSFIQKLLSGSVGAVIYTGLVTVYITKTKVKVEIRAYIKGRVSLNISASQIFSELC